MLLDDVMSELDKSRREYILTKIQASEFERELIEGEKINDKNNNSS